MFITPSNSLSSPPSQAETALGSRKRRGASAVEFAVVSSVFFVLVLGIIEIGRALMVMHLLTNGARAACRYAVAGLPQTSTTSGYTTTTTPGSITTAQVQANVVANMSAVGITVTTSQVTVPVRDSTSNDVSTAASGDEITVRVSVPASSVTWIPTLGFLVGNLSGQYTMRHE